MGQPPPHKPRREGLWDWGSLGFSLEIGAVRSELQPIAHESTQSAKKTQKHSKTVLPSASSSEIDAGLRTNGVGGSSIFCLHAGGWSTKNCNPSMKVQHIPEFCATRFQKAGPTGSWLETTFAPETALCLDGSDAVM